MREELARYDMDLDNAMAKTLGLFWKPHVDKMCYSVQRLPMVKNPESDYTKKFMLSDTAKIFDPLGGLAPTVMSAKLMFKQLWQSGTGWDEPMPQEIRDCWLKWRTDLTVLNNVEFERCLVPKDKLVLEHQIHGFSDAAQSG